MTPFEELQQSRNRESIDAWQLYAPHRERVTSLILRSLGSESSGRVCLLGAGNCNDIDLHRLVDRGCEVHLIDIDTDAMRRGIERQGLTGDDRIRMSANVDVTGLFNQLQPNATEESALTTEVMTELAATAQEHSPGLNCGSFDVVASVCLLSQLIDAVTRSFPDPNVALPLVQAVRRRHLRLLLELCRTRGQAILFSEVVSSDTCPELAATADEHLPGLLAQLLAAQNFFTGLHPGVIHQELQTEPSISPLVSDVRSVPPWKWPFLYRTYAVTAFIAERAADATVAVQGE